MALRVAVFLALLMSAAGISTGRVADAQGPARSPCDTVPPGLGSLFPAVDLLVLGEIHGSREIPAFALQALCAVLVHPEPVVLGVEVWTSLQMEVNDYLASAGGKKERERLLAGEFWGSVNDGRSSQAMLELIEGVRVLRSLNAAVSVVCFDNVEDLKAGETRDIAMGRFLLAHRTEHPDSRYVILTGNIHARTAIGTPWDPQLEPMTRHLSAAKGTLRSLDARHSGGTFWACAPECGIQRFRGAGASEAQGVELFDERDDLGFDGVFDVGPATSSAPAAQARPE